MSDSSSISEPRLNTSASWVKWFSKYMFFAKLYNITIFADPRLPFKSIMETEPQAPSIQELKELETANLRVAHARSCEEYAATPSEQIYARFPLGDPSKAPPPQASYKDIKDEYEILMKEHHMRKETWKT
ncbi:hypothetical protein B2J93_3034 [Marssonina coronariae]|uniref:Uncharacterized protein n=1 Tax=Diplocarpon coronariae TaxID=2795749 RepID=A0A218Z0S5_9HELO|nr:hypothetical protein B2J93_3034 [Marssonina coronariae]